MLARRLSSFLKLSPKPQVSSSTKNVDEEKSKYFGRKAVSFVLITVTGGVALSALDDVAIYHGCSSKAMEKASKNQAIIDALGEPIVKGPWYNASLAVAHKRHSVSCTFPVSGPQGTGVLQLKAVRNRVGFPFSFLVIGTFYSWMLSSMYLGMRRGIKRCGLISLTSCLLLVLLALSAYLVRQIIQRQK